jgi:peptidoglycan/LPS O-acetylase OafA/YrhL
MVADAGRGHDTGLHGLRGLAVLIVIASHSGFAGMEGQGGAGVWLFFVLSGFLLSRPFLERPALLTSWRNLLAFMKRRLLRIVPAYWVVVLFLCFPFTESNEVRFFYMNMPMISGDGHLWSVKQELVLYVILPFLMVPAVALRRWPMMAMAVCAVIAALVNEIVDASVLTLAGNGQHLRLYAFPFISGICAALFQRSLLFDRLKANRAAPVLCDTVTVVAITCVVLTSIAWLQAISSIVGLNLSTSSPLAWGRYYVVYCAGAALLIISIESGRGYLTRKLFTFAPLVACGVLGYSMYLIHPSVLFGPIGRSLGGAGISAFLWCVPITFIISCVLYGFVERVFWLPSYGTTKGDAGTARDTSSATILADAGAANYHRQSLINCGTSSASNPV